MTIDQRAPVWLIAGLTALLDSGRLDHVTTADVREHARKRDVLEWLHILAPEFDVAMFDPEGPYAWFGPYLNDYCEAVAGESVVGGDRKGICLLLAWTTDILRRGSGWKPTDDFARSRRHPDA